VRLSKKAEYALRAVVAMGRRGAGCSIQIQEMSHNERIPVKFLEHILLTLKKADLLRSKRGAGGGYQLNRPPEAITLGEVIELIEGPFLPLSCSSPGTPGRCGCGQFKPCGLGAVFGDLQNQLSEFLGKRTVADVIACEQHSTPMFDI
jgi:Rrf2 family protein